MLLAGDESTTYHWKVYGFVCIPLKYLPQLEYDFSKTRIETKKWGEIDWKSIPSPKRNIESYIKFIDIFLNNPEIQYHGIIYPTQLGEDIKQFFGRRDKELIKFRHVEIKCICRLIQNKRIAESIYILCDQRTDEDGIDNELLETKKTLEIDSGVNVTIDYCGSGKSHLCSAIQISDLITGAIAAKKNNKISNDNQQKIVDYIEKSIGYELAQNMPKPVWGQYKINTWECNPAEFYKNHSRKRDFLK